MSRGERPGAATSPSQRERWGVRGLAVGIALGGGHRAEEWPELLAWCERAETMGLHSVWLPEMHFAPNATTSPLLALAAFAARTRTLRLATTSVLLPIHHPLQIAREVAHLDRLSGGRVILGLGRGFRAPLFAAFGIDPATKRDRFDAALDCILAAFEGRPEADAPGLFPALDAEDTPASCYRTCQSPHPPLAVAAFGRKGLEQAARRGLPYLASPVEPLGVIEENLAHHRAHVPAARVDPEPVVPVMRTVFVSRRTEARRRVLEALGDEQQARPARLPPAIARAVAAPLSERAVVGDVDEVAARLAEYRARLGMNLLIVRPQLQGASPAERCESLRLLMEQVVPSIA